MRALAHAGKLVSTAALILYLESHGVHVNLEFKLGLLTFGSDFPIINLKECLMTNNNSTSKRTDSPLFLRSLNQSNLVAVGS